MKSKLGFVLFFLLVVVNANAQNAGVYMNVTDYQQNKLSYISDCNKTKNAIRLHELFTDRPIVTIITDGHKLILKKKDLYGYRDCRGYVYRFYKNSEYKIVETGSICIYTQEDYVSQYKKPALVVYRYYFSTSPDADIQLLTLSKLKQQYKDNSKFLDLLDTYFNNLSLSAYDDIHKMYKLNYVYSRSLN